MCLTKLVFLCKYETTFRLLVELTFDSQSVYPDVICIHMLI